MSTDSLDNYFTFEDTNDYLNLVLHSNERFFALSLKKKERSITVDVGFFQMVDSFTTKYFPSHYLPTF